MKHLITASFIALSAALTPSVSLAMPSGSPDVEAIGDAVQTPAPQVRAVDGGIELTAPDDAAKVFMIYSITGQLVKKVSVGASASRAVNLPGGCYVVKCKDWTKKVVVS